MEPDAGTGGLPDVETDTGTGGQQYSNTGDRQVNEIGSRKMITMKALGM